MSQDEGDPTASTDKFRAFVEEEGAGTSQPERRNRMAVPVLVLGGVLIVVVVLWLLL